MKIINIRSNQSVGRKVWQLLAYVYFSIAKYFNNGFIGINNISIASVGSTLIPLWMDNSSGLYQVWTARVPISSLVSVNAPKQIPAEFRLEQNFPNPFNPSTTIIYHIPEQSFVSLTLYDVLGNKIETLVQREQSAGEHYVNFSAQNVLSSGVYFYRLDAGKYSAYKKLMILK